MVERDMHPPIVAFAVAARAEDISRGFAPGTFYLTHYLNIPNFNIPQITSLPNWIPVDAQDGLAFEETAFLAAFFRPSAFSDDDVWLRRQ